MAAAPLGASDRRDVIRVVLAEDHPLMLSALVGRLAKEADLDVVGTATNGEDLVEVHRSQRPDVLVTDGDLPRLSGPDAIRRLRDEDPDVRAIVLSGHADAGHVTDAIEAGAIGYLLKAAAGDELVRAIRAAARGELVFDDFAARVLVTHLRSRAEPEEVALSERQLDVLELLAQGRSREAIASELSIGRATVSTHLKQIYQRLGTGDRLQAVRRATELGLLDADGRRTSR